MTTPSPEPTWPPDVLAAAESCPRCGHARRDTLGVCPECGVDEATARRLRRRGSPRARWTRAVVGVLVAVYAPQSWVLLMPGDWSGHRLSWIRMYPVLPGLLPAAVGRSILRYADAMMLVVAGIATAVLLAAGFWFASRGPRWFVATCLVLFGIGIPLAFMLHAAYAA